MTKEDEDDEEDENEDLDIANQEVVDTEGIGDDEVLEDDLEEDQPVLETHDLDLVDHTQEADLVLAQASLHHEQEQEEEGVLVGR